MRPEKASIIDDLRQRLDASPFLLLIDYAGLNVLQFSELRNRLAAQGAACKVVKNTFLRRAASELGLPELNGVLQGQSAIVTGDKDVCAAAKVLKNFKAEFQKPALKLGVLDKALLSAEQVAALADLPPKEVLQAQFLGLLQTPAGNLVRLLNEPASRLARVLQAKADQAAEPEAAAAA